MYTSYPLPDMSADHFGLYVITALIVFALWIILFDLLAEDLGPGWKAFWCIIGFVIFGFAAKASYAPDTHVNLKVTGHLVGFTAEGFIEGSGKHATEHHDLYVTYRTPDGLVVLPAHQGFTYPEIATLYKN